jgi:transketolase
VREGFKEAILLAAKADSRVHILTGDHGYELFDQFRSEFPGRFHNVGVAESNMVGMAAGFARNGLKPLIYGLASFVPNRVFEFIKLQIALDSLPVVIVGDGAGVVYSFLGKSHQTLEDLALMGSLPQVRTLSPASDKEMKKATEWALNQSVPVYLRIGKSGGVFDGCSEADSPKPLKITSSHRPTNIAVVAHGSMVSSVLKAQNDLQEINFDTWSCPTVFPIDSDFLSLLSDKYRKVIVVEEHQLRGGLASELIIKLHSTDTKISSICAQPNDLPQVGSYEWNLSRHGLSHESLVLGLRNASDLS